jgi:predicted ATP-dependent endonuclease of OLD family
LEKTNNNIENEKYYVFIDEPEKFCHPNLLNKLIKQINKISLKVNLYISSHSPSFISKLYDFENKPSINFFFGKWKNENNMKEISKNIFDLDDNSKFRKILLQNSIYREEFTYNIFAEKIIIVEDNSTKIFIQ